MLAAVFEGNGKLTLREVPVPEIRSKDEVLLQVTGVGICGTDLHILHVPQIQPSKVPVILGHEFTGRVVESGDSGSSFRPGDAVVIKPFPGCGVCPQCKRGFPDLCEKLLRNPYAPGHPATIGMYSDGGMAEYAVVPEAALYGIRGDVPPHLAALAEPFADVLNAVEKVKIQPGDTVVVLGAGPIGLMFMLMARANGASRVIAADLSENRRQVALKCGADTVVDPGATDLNAAVREIDPEGADIVVEAVGHLLAEAVHVAGRGGQIVQFGHDEKAHPPVPVSEIVRREIVIRGSFLCRFTFPRAVEMLESGQIALDRVVSHVLPLTEVHRGVELMNSQQALKVIITPDRQGG